MVHPRLLALTVILGAVALAAACGDDAPEADAKKKDEAPKAVVAADGPITAAMLPTPADPHLAKGKDVWTATCQPCHGTGLGGAPKIGNKALWGPRIAKGMDTLVEHALKGFSGKNGDMPPRGGNDKLTDDDIKAAVAFMVSLGR